MSLQRYAAAAARRLRRWTAPAWRRVTPMVQVTDAAGLLRLAETEAPPLVNTPELPSMHLFPQAEALRRATYAPPRMWWALLGEAWFEAGRHVLLDAEGQLVCESVSTRPEASLLGLRRALLPRESRIEGACTTIRSFHNSYYHTLIDNLPRLWVLGHAATALGIRPALLFGSPPSPAEAYLVPRLAPKGTEIRQVDGERRYRVDRFLLPGFLTRRFAGWLPPDYLQWLRERVAPARPSRRDRRIWISRRPTQTRAYRRVLNEGELLETLGALGFERHILEDLAIPEQIELFHDAEIVVAPHGAGLANLVFSTGANVLELFPSRWAVPHYYLLSKACGHRYAALHANGRHRNSNFRVDVVATAAVVERWLEGEGR